MGNQVIGGEVGLDAEDLWGTPVRKVGKENSKHVNQTAIKGNGSINNLLLS